MNKPEQEVQSLQECLINTLINTILGIADVPVILPKNRKMWLDYVSYLSLSSFSNVESIRHHLNAYLRETRLIHFNPIESAKATADGALILKTDKATGGYGRMLWNKHGAVLGFEVHFSIYCNSL